MRNKDGAKSFLCVAALFVTIATPSQSFAQTNERIYSNLEFKVVTPGARAVAMGKAFVGIADDATAAASNPAGLSNLFDPELSFEWTGTDLRHRQFVGFKNGEAFPQSDSDWVQQPTFLSYVAPFPPGSRLRNVTLAAFYNSLQRYESHFDITHTVPGLSPDQVGELGYAGDIDVRGDAFGAGGAILIHPRLSIGGALTFQLLKNQTVGVGYDPGGSKYISKNGTRTDDSDSALGWQVGVLAKLPAGISLGVSYLPGSTFELETEIFGLFNPDDNPPERPHSRALPVTAFNMTPQQAVEYRIPDRLTLGGAKRFGSSFTAVADVAFVKYSQRINDKFLIVDFLGQPITAHLDWTQYHLPNVVETHAGFEWRRPRGFGTLAIRGGFFVDPQHQMLFDEEETNTSGPGNSQRERFNSYQPGPAYGGSFGVGFVLKNRYQIDTAFSGSRNALEFVASTVIRFPR